MTEAAIRSALGTDPPDVFRTEVLCQSVDALDGAFDATAWRECGDDQGTLSDTEPGRLAVGFDVAEDGTHATLAGAALMGDGRVRTAIIRAWRDTKTARAEVGALIRDLEPAAVAWFPGGPAARLAPVFTGLKDDDGLNVVGLQGGAQAAAAQGLVDLVAARAILHPRDALQTAHITGSRKLPNADGGFRFVRKGAGAVDATYATAGAVHEALTMPEPVVPRLRSM